MPRVTISPLTPLDPMFREGVTRSTPTIEDRVEMRGRTWRRTNLTLADGSLPPDDWSLIDEAIRAAALDVSSGFDLEVTDD